MAGMTPDMMWVDGCAALVVRVALVYARIRDPEGPVLMFQNHALRRASSARSRTDGFCMYELLFNVALAVVHVP